MATQGNIHIVKAEANNLRGFDVDIPRGKFTVITGVSGSGKTSLAFDTLFAEGQRRFAESLSSFARQFLGRMSKPAVDSISGIPPAIAIEQRVNTRNPRSTVGSTTEIYDYLRILFAKIGRTYSPISGCEVRCDSVATVLERLKGLSLEHVQDTATLYLLADIRWDDERYRTANLLSLKEEGFTRLFDVKASAMKKIDAVLSGGVEQYSDSEIMLLLDRTPFSAETFKDEETGQRMLDSIRTAFEKGNGRIACVIIRDNTGEYTAADTSGITAQLLRFSNIFEADGMQFEQPTEWMFNYNNPLGACKNCGGLGKIIGIDESLVIPNQALSVYQGAVACWKGEVMRYFKEQLILHADKFDFPVHTPYKDLTAKQKKTLWEGNEFFVGIRPFFRELEAKRYKIQNKYMISRYSGKTVCHECGGSRLRPDALYVRLGGRNIDELMSMSIRDLAQFFKEIRLEEYEQTIASKALREISSRLEYLENVGLGYLTLSRASNTLSGGESQRIALVCQLGNTLTGSMYILDEPSIGLHSRDTQRLINVIYKLRDIGNTVIVVSMTKR